MASPEVSVLLCTFNRADMLAGALESLCSGRSSEIDFEIVVVDDGSTDSTRIVVGEMAARLPVVIRYVRESGVGVAAARNRCLQEARGEWLAFFDDDQLAEPGWLDGLLSCARQEGVWYVGGQRTLDLDPETLSSLSLTGRALLGELCWNDPPCPARRRDVPAMGSVLVHRSVFDLIGGFDDSLVRGGEDLDLFRRARSAGIEIWNTASSVCRHRVPAYRLEPRYLLWVSRRVGENFACRDMRDAGSAMTFSTCAARILCSLVVAVPLLAWCVAMGERRRALEHRCSLARTAGYVRHCLSRIAPLPKSGAALVRDLEFRGERALFSRGGRQHGPRVADRHRPSVIGRGSGERTGDLMP